MRFNQHIHSSLIAQLSGTRPDPQRLEDVVRPLLCLLEEVTGLSSTYFTKIDEDKGTQTIIYARNIGELQIPEGLEVPWADTLCQRAIAEGRTFTSDVAGCWGDSDAARELGICTYLSEPIRLGENMLYGTLCAASTSSIDVPESTQHHLALFSDLIARYIEREELLTFLFDENLQLNQHAHIDPLTGVFNRRALMQILEKSLSNAAKNNEALHVAFIDLDGFKEINDRYGHDAGDRFLIQIAKHLTSGSGEHDIIARYGGDEFVFIRQTDNHRNIHQERAFIKRQLEAMTQGEFPVCDDTINYGGASVGVITTMENERDIQQILQRSDEAMYASKKARRKVE
ncbi:GGDEF domain-containing protein [Onishia taeanensis]